MDLSHFPVLTHLSVRTVERLLVILLLKSILALGCNFIFQTPGRVVTVLAVCAQYLFGVTQVFTDWSIMCLLLSKSCVF